MSEENTNRNTTPAKDDYEHIRSLKTLTAVVYALQAASIFVGITFLIAIIVNYVKRSDVEGTYLASHFTWQIRTFWYGLLWGIAGFVLVFIVVGYFILLANTVWIIYRIGKGWLRLSDDKSAYEK
ncbi:MAG: hypothetical protein KZQ93_13995 [Candidatus Thiodiazotropha sp. (ex Monitilora ramsayi)]|nr:hypothetical protein [Candidatus Thiodiazotropha sp. (ex Monitilora ramsayi)]